jgi:cation transport ATPase
MPGLDERTQVKIDVLGMTCAGCARTLENEFRKFRDIEYTVNLTGRNIVVRYSPESYRRGDFEQAIEAHGYRVKGKEY